MELQPPSLYSESPLYISLNPGPSAPPSLLAAIPCDHARTHVNKTASNCPHWSCWCCYFAAVGYIRCNWSWCRGDKATLTLSPISPWCHTHGRPLSCLPPIVVDGRQMGWGGKAAWRHGARCWLGGARRVEWRFQTCKLLAVRFGFPRQLPALQPPSPHRPTPPPVFPHSSAFFAFIECSAYS